MNLSLRPEHLKRYKDFALLLWKYGRRDLVARAGLSELLPHPATQLIYNGMASSVSKRRLSQMTTRSS